MELVMEVKGRKLLFRFTTRAWYELEQKIGSLNKLLDRIEGDDRPLDAMIELAAQTATAGERFMGGSGKITRDYLIDNLSPKQIRRANALAKTALTVGMHREEADQDDNEVIDVVLEELEKKTGPMNPGSLQDSASATA